MVRSSPNCSLRICGGTMPAVIFLGIGNVLHPFGVEIVVVKEIGFPAGLFGTVAQPALALVALRAIGGDAAIIIAHAPNDVVTNLVEQRIGGFKAASDGQVV